LSTKGILHSNNPPAAISERKFELDWLRVIVTIDLIPFHVAWMITHVIGFSFVVKGTVAWNILHGYVRFISPLHMFLLFLVAGTSTSMALRYRSPRQYVTERIKRLLIPLLTFMIFLFPVLGYYWPTATDLSEVDYLTRFWPWCLMTTFYSETTGGPNWAHMWFVGYLFIYSMVFLPLFMLIRTGKSPFIESWTNFLTSRRGAIFVMGIPPFMAFAILSPIWPFFRNNLYSDWGYFAYNMSAFYFGFIIARDPRWSQSIDRHMVVSIVLGILFSAAKLLMEYSAPSFATPAYNMRYIFYSLVAGLNTWFWVVAVLGLARRTLSFSNGFLAYFNRISYPFYVFHLVIITVVGHYIAHMRRGIVAEFFLMCAVSFAFCILCCELVKSTPVTRFLFGIKGKGRRRPKTRGDARQVMTM
jgi:glucan biosynthesis protein C